MEPRLKDLIGLAEGAGKIVRAGYRKANHISNKGVVDLVTEVDRQSEEYLLNHFAEKFPGHRVVAEESGGIDGDGGWAWYVDPLDGTTNFAHKLPIFSISIAAAFEGELRLGVVYNPIKEEMFSAEAGKGAWLNGKPIQASRTEELVDSLMVTGFPYDRHTNPDNNLNYFSRFLTRVQGVRRLGSAALDFCFVACGRVDGYWEIRLEQWDIAAGTLVAREAGAVVTKMDGRPEMLPKPISVCAANPALHEKMLEVIAGE